MKVSDFDYDLPAALIAQCPVEPRDASRLLVLDGEGGTIAHRRFRDLVDYLRPGDVLVANDTRVIPARLFGRKPTGGRLEILLLEQRDETTWRALVGGRKVGVGLGITLLDHAGEPADVTATVTAVAAESLRELRFSRPVQEWIDDLGYAPLPPYIHEPLADAERYQTIYARLPGSAAAPTAGLHFTPELLTELEAAGVGRAAVTLHVGYGTFQPVRADLVEDHRVESERYVIPDATAQAFAEARRRGGRIVAVGTTTTRALETAVGDDGLLRPGSGSTELFLRPGSSFRAVDALVTNFHLPKSSLLMLVAGFAGRELVLEAYRHAVREGYRFYSYGDAMLIV